MRFPLRAPRALWSGRRPLLQAALTPLSLLYRSLVAARRGAYRIGLLRRHRLPVPVVVVGNVTVGGTGKTPLVAAIGKILIGAGLKPGVVMRGYGGSRKKVASMVDLQNNPDEVGDEALLLARHMPVAIAADRVAAGRVLLDQARCDLIISDDGLQHYRLERDLEIAVVDGRRWFGNGLCLPAGPMREPVSRLEQVDAVVVNGGSGPGQWSMQLEIGRITNLLDPTITRTLESFRASTVRAIAGIGDPERFFDSLCSGGLEVLRHPFPDHHRYCVSDLNFGDDLPLLMTEKDGVKCTRWARPGWWTVPVTARLDPAFEAWLLASIGLRAQQ